MSLLGEFLNLNYEEKVPENPLKLKVPKKFRNDLDDFKLEYQELAEEFWGDVDPKLGEVNKEIHENFNKVHDIGKNVYDTVYNARDAVDIRRFIYFHWNGETELSLGDHLFVYRPFFTHHGLYVGEEQVIHYARGKVRLENFNRFTYGCQICVLPPSESPLRHSKTEAINRAKSRLGEREYNLITNNCEHFVRWCRDGKDGI